MKKICVVTGTRADYGLLRWLMDGIRRSPLLELQLVATGSHLVREFGSTIDEIESDGFRVDRKVEMLLADDSAVGVAKSMGLAIMGLADALASLKPDLLVILGDRYEILAAASSATVAGIPIAHLHGGEVTEGVFDEAMRHAITKLSHLHFVAAEEYRVRVIQLGESPDRVFVVGGLGIDNILRLRLMDRPSLEDSLGLKFGQRNLLVTFHPVTLDRFSGEAQMEELLHALAELPETRLIFTMPNADTGGRSLFRQVQKFASQHPNARVYKSLGQLRYLSCMAQVDAVVGNSSSGLTEVSSFKKASVNIGNRQAGRICAESVIHCEPEKRDILRALERAYSPEFQNRLVAVDNPYGSGGASAAIVEIIEKQNFSTLIPKKFHDLPR